MLVDEFGAEVNKKRMFGDTALTGATIKGHHEIVRFLVKRGAQPGVNRCSEEDFKAIFAAASSGSPETLVIRHEEGTGNLCTEDGFACSLSDAAAVTSASFVRLAGFAAAANRTLKIEFPKERARRNAVMAYLARKQCACCGELADTKTCARCRVVTYTQRIARHWRMHRSDCYAETSTSSAASRPRAADAKLCC